MRRAGRGAAAAAQVTCMGEGRLKAEGQAWSAPLQVADLQLELVLDEELRCSHAAPVITRAAQGRLHGHHRLLSLRGEAAPARGGAARSRNNSVDVSRQS